VRAAHAKGIVHRDLKPDNIVRDPDIPDGERTWIAPVVAVVAVAGGAAVIAITQSGDRSATAVKAPEPASPEPAPQPPAPPTSRAAGPRAFCEPSNTGVYSAGGGEDAHARDHQAGVRAAGCGRLPHAARRAHRHYPLTYSMDAIEGEVVLIVKRRGYVDQQFAVPADHDTDRTVTLARVATRPHEPKPPGPGSSSTSSGEPQEGTLDPFDKLAP
jgi:serine/threonine protein kinase